MTDQTPRDHHGATTRSAFMCESGERYCREHACSTCFGGGEVTIDDPGDPATCPACGGSGLRSDELETERALAEPDPRRTVAHGAPVTEDPADERSIETVADLDRWGGPASEVLEPVEPVVRTQEEIRQERPALAVEIDPELTTGTLYPTCSAWALAKIDALAVTQDSLGQLHRAALLALAADADRGLHSPNGYNGTSADRLAEILSMTTARVLAGTLHLTRLRLIDERETADETIFRLPERFLAYMRD
jgi:hypothetical protein